MARRRPAPANEARTPWAWAVGGAVLGLLTSLVLFAPARWLATGLAAATEDRVRLQEPRGTVWNGTAQLVLTGGDGSRDAVALPERLGWEIRPGLSGASVALMAQCCMAQPWRLDLLPRWTGARVQMTDGGSRWPASMLTGLGTPWNTVQPEGTLLLSTRGLAVEWLSGRMLVDGRIVLEASDLSSRLTTLKPMGSYRLTLAGGAGEAPVSLQLETLSGSLTLTGSGQWVGSRLRFDGVASAAPDRVDALSNLLNILGRRDGTRAIMKLG